MTQGLQIGIPQRLAILRTVTTLALVASLLITYKLWFTRHLFPAAALVPELISLNAVSFYISLAACITLLASLIFRWHRLLLGIALLCIILLVASDYNRLRHWVYVYGALLLVMVFYNGRVDDPNRFTSYFIILQLLVCSVYLFSGIHQLQPRFIHDEIAQVIAPVRAIVSDRQFGFLLKLGWAVPFALIFIAASLFISQLRYLGLTLAVLLHLSLAILLWPLRKGDAAGYVFNLFMIPAVILLFSGRTRQRYFSPSFVFQRPAFWLMIAAFWVMPAFNNANRWPDACSANVHAGNRVKAKIELPVSAYLRLPSYVKLFCVPANGVILLDHHLWSRFDIGITCSDEPPVLDALLAQIEFWNRGPVKDMRLSLTPKEKLLIMP